jgi:hypothetical protein
MVRPEIESLLNSLIDDLAAIEHERWAHWQAYMHSKGEIQPDGSLVVPPELVERWQSQIEEPFKKLSQAEKESDREQVRRYLPLIASAFEEYLRSSGDEQNSD